MLLELDDEVGVLRRLENKTNTAGFVDRLRSNIAKIVPRLAFAEPSGIQGDALDVILEHMSTQTKPKPEKETQGTHCLASGP